MPPNDEEKPMRIEDLPEGCALVERAWKEINSGVDGRAPSRTTGLTTDPKEAEKWEKNTYVRVEACFKFTLSNGDAYYSRSTNPTENVNVVRRKDEALAKLTKIEKYWDCELF